MGVQCTVAWGGGDTRACRERVCGPGAGCLLRRVVFAALALALHCRDLRTKPLYLLPRTLELVLELNDPSLLLHEKAAAERQLELELRLQAQGDGPALRLLPLRLLSLHHRSRSRLLLLRLLGHGAGRPGCALVVRPGVLRHCRELRARRDAWLRSLPWHRPASVTLHRSVPATGDRSGSGTRLRSRAALCALLARPRGRRARRARGSAAASPVLGGLAHLRGREELRIDLVAARTCAREPCGGRTDGSTEHRVFGCNDILAHAVRPPRGGGVAAAQAGGRRDDDRRAAAAARREPSTEELGRGGGLVTAVAVACRFGGHHVRCGSR